MVDPGDAQRGDGVRRVRLHRPLRGQAAGGAGYVVRVAVRDPEAALFLKPMGAVGQVVPLYAVARQRRRRWRARSRARTRGQPGRHPGRAPARRLPARARRGRRARRPLARAAPGVRAWCMSRRSAPTRPARAAMRAARARARQAVRDGLSRARRSCGPSIVFGPEDQFFNRFGSMAQICPVMPVICRRDAVPAGLCRRRGGRGHGLAHAGRMRRVRLYELGGPRVWTFRELLAYILTETRRRRRMIDDPAGLGAAAGRVLERLPGKLLTRDQLLLLRATTSCRQACRACRAGHRADAGRAGRAALSAPLPAGRRQARGSCRSS